jgi:hypothetical protein
MTRRIQHHMTCARHKLLAGALLFAGPLLVTPIARAQSPVTPPEASQTPSAAVARVSGADVSVESSRGSAAAASAHDFSLLSGDVIIVHSGEARLMFTAGGEAGICGPAKLTVLESAGAITVALEYGRAHVKLADSMPVTLYTPFYVVTPMALTEGPREMTLGLETGGKLCVRATQGGIRIEQQLSGQSIIVPQPREIFLSDGGLTPVPGAAGYCSCELAAMRDSPHPFSAVPQVPPAAAAKPTPAPVTPASPVPAPPAPAPTPKKPDQPRPSPAPHPSAGIRREFSLVASASDVHPIAPAPNSQVPAPPALEYPEWKVIMPALTFDASSPAAPPGPSAATILLIREVQVQPDWVFTGRVAPKRAHSRKSHDAPPQTAASSAAPPPTVPSPAAKSGFWSKLRGWFSRKP